MLGRGGRKSGVLCRCIRLVYSGWTEELPSSHLIEECAAMPIKQLPCREAIEFGRNPTPDQLIHSAEYVRRELVVRLARSIRSFQALPYIVCINPHVSAVLRTFCDAFTALQAVPPLQTVEEERRFTAALTGMFRETSDAIATLAKGIKEIRQLPGSLNINHGYLDAFIDSFLVQRISRRVIAEHHMGLHQQRDGWVGAFNMQTSPAGIIHDVMHIAQETCSSLYGVCPGYRVTGDIDACLAYIPVHLEYILLELSKNALRATVEKHQRAATLPEVVVRICAGRDIVLIVQDKGGGIDATGLARIWGYGYTTFVRPPQGGGLWQDYHERVAGLHAQRDLFAGYGFGLPTCRVYARYLGGNVEIVTMAGHGTDVFITLKPVDGPGSDLLL
eukprot:GGOE01004619.1.p1 GENE.GGOE01004619.1~~GGOE01004619.1.p1  ORF type:complete len:389 (-),score=94.15 GGOE01004619.1:181-1347(-)